MALSKRAQKFQDLLNGRGLNLTVKELPDLTRTADDAAAALGCRKAQIVKSLVFRNAETNNPILILVSGINRVNEEDVSRSIGVELAKADADYVKEKTGFSIGGVPPVGHKEAAVVIVDEDLLDYDELWAAAGTPHAVFRIDGEITKILSDYRVMRIC